MITKELLLLNKSSKLLIQSVSKRFLAPTSQKPRPEKKHYRLWAVPGDLVYIKDILARQYTMKWHPGLNAGIDENWDYPLVQEAYMRDEKRAPSHRRYIHVIPKRRVSEFKLIDLI